MSDYELVYMAQEHIEEARDALYNKYKKYIDTLVQSFYDKKDIEKLDIEDIKLECMLVFEKAIDSYNQDKDSKFSTYLYTCLDAKLKDLIRKFNNKKDCLNNYSLSYYEDLGGIKIIDMLYNNKDLVENIVVNDIVDFDTLIKDVELSFTKLEFDVLTYLVKDYKPEKIATILKIDTKKVYNTIYRIKFKFKKQLINNNGGM